ncbi:4158_t:CDS:2, partial [Rhizophagus irregularis]
SAYDRRTLSHRYRWSFKGSRVCKPIFFVCGRRYTIEGALCLNGLLAYAIQEGPINSNNYNDFVENILLPKMNAYPDPYSVLVLDNAFIHKGQHLLDICNTKEVRIEYLPSYSPDLNLIEQAFFYIKNHLRQNRYWIESML